jgi:hypothetical protein
MDNLLQLDLGRANLRHGAKALLESPHLKNLLYLNLDGSYIPTALKAPLRKRFRDVRLS